MKRKSYDGYRHIAAAIFVECDFIISWNFKHIVKVKTIQGIKAITKIFARNRMLRLNLS